MEKTGMVKFSKAVKGYDAAEVDEFVSKLSNIFGTDDAEDMEKNLWKMTRCLVGVQEAQCFCSADLEGLRGLLRSGRKCYFAYSESEIAQGSVRKVIDDVVNSPNVKGRLGEAAALLLHISASGAQELTELGYGLGGIDWLIKKDCKIMLNIVDHPENRIEFSMMLIV